MKSILRRIEDLEALYKKDPIIVVAVLNTGERKKMSMTEFISRKDVDPMFQRVSSGSDLKDVRRFLDFTTSDYALKTMTEHFNAMKAAEQEGGRR